MLTPAERDLLIKMLGTMTLAEEKAAEKEEGDKTEVFKSDPGKHIEELRQKYDALKQKVELKEGDIVTWKDGMRNRKWPLEDQPCILTKKLSDPEEDEDEGEMIDIHLGFVVDNGTFQIFAYPSSRFKAYDDKK